MTMRLLRGALLAALGALPWAAKAQSGDPVAEVARTGGAGAKIIRIEADFDNDGLPDLALTTSDACGNKTCAFVLFLRRPDGTHVRVGELGSLPFGYRIVPVSPGLSRFETCTASGDIVHHVSVHVSRAGPSSPARSPVPARDDGRCRWEGTFEWSECGASEYICSGSCRWTLRAWP